ncbi:hypothetical protein FH972_026011 [Carpinus fangiana]|uniref:GTP:AMP phosphotransferase, mitochondrial n=1 Tax=Carpinus fangiana TaxID=176857 RepID=A0A5N6L2X7_9ROSI|nr:hypothetical protein FH972_026011 [Carpinus fangiana]
MGRDLRSAEGHTLQAAPRQTRPSKRDAINERNDFRCMDSVFMREGTDRTGPYRHRTVEWRDVLISSKSSESRGSDLSACDTFPRKHGTTGRPVLRRQNRRSSVTSTPASSPTLPDTLHALSSSFTSARNLPSTVLPIIHFPTARPNPAPAAVASAMQLSRAARVILIGAPGVGKGTQAERMLSRFPQLSSIASGDLLRDNVRRKTALGMQAQKLMESGALVPDAMILRLIFNELRVRGWMTDRAAATPYTLNSSAAAGSTTIHTPPGGPLYASQSYDLEETFQLPTDVEISSDPGSSFILDGFPRTAAQAVQLDSLVPINMVVHIHTPPNIILERIANRWIHEPSGRIYNTTFNPPEIAGKDDVTGEPLTQREDDSEVTWKTRLKKFEETSLPLLEHYDNQGLLWRVDGNSSDEISPKLYEEFESRFGKVDHA